MVEQQWSLFSKAYIDAVRNILCCLGATLRPQSVQQPSQNCARDLLPTGSDVTSSAFVNSVFPIPPSTVGTGKCFVSSWECER